MGVCGPSFGELIEHWTLVGRETDLVSANYLDTRLTFALLLKFYGRHGQFPRSRGELHPDAVEFMARSLKADPASVAAYDWSGRTIERHRGQIRRHFGFRVCGEEEAKLAEFLAGDFAQRERRYEVVREQFLGECRARELEPPTADQVDRYVRTALFQGARLLSGRITGRLSGQNIARIRALVSAKDGVDDEDPDLLRMIKAAPGPVSLASMLTEIDKLTAIGSFGLPEGGSAFMSSLCWRRSVLAWVGRGLVPPVSWTLTGGDCQPREFDASGPGRSSTSFASRSGSSAGPSSPRATAAWARAVATTA